jgi:uncharacterized protein YcgI (DUF1989 family)
MEMSVSFQEQSMIEIEAQAGTAFRLRAGQTLNVIDKHGSQVADLFCFPTDDLTDPLSSGRSIDYNDTIHFTTGHTLYANSGRVLMKIVGDTCGRHDFLVTPCSLQMFRMMAGDETVKHPSCHANLSTAFAEFSVDPSRITTTFNIFMNVPVGAHGRIQVLTPISVAGDSTSFRAETDLIVGLTACSDEGSNGGRCKAIEFEIT